VLVLKFSTGSFDNADLVGAGIVAARERRGILAAIQAFITWIRLVNMKLGESLRIPPALVFEYVSIYISKSSKRNNIRMLILWIPW
jgi:hypothetical protein